MATERHVTMTIVDGLRLRATTSTGHEVTLDAGESVGGGNAGMRPTEAILMALGACAAMDVAALLRKMRQSPDEYELRVSGVPRVEHPRIFTSITVSHRLTGASAEPQVRRAIALSIGRYCPVYAMLAPTVPIRVEYQINDGFGRLAASGVVTPDEIDRA
jgi:putative redox protein